MIIRHKVDDFDQWKPKFDAHASQRVESQLEDVLVLRDDDDPDHVLVIFKADSLETARSFASDPDLHDRMIGAGVIDNPDVYFLNEA